MGISLDCFVASLLAMTVKGIVIASPPKAGVAISYFQKEGVPNLSFKKKIATPDCLRIQARNDRDDEGASLIAIIFINGSPTASR